MVHLFRYVSKRFYFSNETFFDFIWNFLKTFFMKSNGFSCNLGFFVWNQFLWKGLFYFIWICQLVLQILQGEVMGVHSMPIWLAFLSCWFSYEKMLISCEMFFVSHFCWLFQMTFSLNFLLIFPFFIWKYFTGVQYFLMKYRWMPSHMKVLFWR